MLNGTRLIHAALGIGLLLQVTNAVLAQPPAGLNDLTGSWEVVAGPPTLKHKFFRISQAGNLVKLDLGNNIVLSGERPGKTLKLSYTWTEAAAKAHVEGVITETGPDGEKAKAAAIKAIAGRVVTVEGAVDETGGLITATYKEQQEAAIVSDGKTKTSAAAGATVQMTLRLLQNVHVVLAVNDRVTRGSSDPLIKQIEGLEKRIDDERHSLSAMRANYDPMKRQFDETDAAFSLANNKKSIAERGVIYFARIAAAQDEQETQSQIAWLKKAITDYDEKHYKPDQNRQLLDDLLKFAQDHLARIRAGEHIVYAHPEDPKSELDQEVKRFIDAVNELNKLDGTWRKQLANVTALGDKVEAASKALADDDRTLSKLNTTLYTSAMTPAIQQVDIELSGGPVYSAVYDPAAACLDQKLKDVQNRMDNDKPYYDDLLATKEQAYQGFRAEGDAAVAVGKKLAGDSRIGIYFSDIMLSAYAQVGADVAASVYDLVKAGRKGGPYGVLAEALQQEMDFAIKYVASGGQDVGYTGVDEAKMEAAAAANLNEFRETWPSKIDRYQKNGVDKATIWGKDKAETFIPHKLDALALNGSLQQAIIETKRAPVLGGEGACKDIARAITGAVSSERARQDELKRLKEALHATTFKGGTLAARARNFANDTKESMIKGGLKAAVKVGANYLESQVWIEYFEHDLRARALFLIWQQAATNWNAEYDYYNGLLEEQKQLLSQQKPGQLVYREMLNRAFAASSSPRQMSVDIKTPRTVSLDVQVERAPAKDLGSAKFVGTVPPGQPTQDAVSVIVSSRPN